MPRVLAKTPLHGPNLFPRRPAELREVVLAYLEEMTQLGWGAGANEGFYALLPYGIGVAKDDTDFRSFINDVLEEIYENGEWADAYARTVGEVSGDTPEPPAVDRY